MTQAADSTGRAGRALTTRRTADEARANLTSVLRLCQEGRLRCSEKSRRPGAATVALVTEVLQDGDFYPGHAIAAFAWPLLVQAGRLAELAGGRMQLTPRGRAILARAPSDALTLLWSRWLASAPIDELSRIEHIRGQSRPNTLTAASRRRQAVGRALAALPPGKWVQIDELFVSMQLDEPPLRVARNDSSIWHLYIAEPRYGSLGYRGFHDWPLLEGRYTLCVLFEYAATLGLIDVRYTDPAGARDDFRGNWGTDDLDYLSRYDGLTAIRRVASLWGPGTIRPRNSSTDWSRRSMTSENNWFDFRERGPGRPIRPAQRFREQGPGSSASPLELISGPIVPGPQVSTEPAMSGS